MLSFLLFGTHAGTEARFRTFWLWAGLPFQGQGLSPQWQPGMWLLCIPSTGTWWTFWEGEQLRSYEAAVSLLLLLLPLHFTVCTLLPYLDADRWSHLTCFSCFMLPSCDTSCLYLPHDYPHSSPGSPPSSISARDYGQKRGRILNLTSPGEACVVGLSNSETESNHIGLNKKNF